MPSNPDDPEAALRAVRQRFIADFPERCRSIVQFLDAQAEATTEERDACVQLVHRMAGLAGMLGFGASGTHARDLEELLRAGPQPGDPGAARRTLTLMQEAFSADLSGKQPSWARTGSEPTGARVLLVEDDPDQRALLETALAGMGFSVSTADRGDVVIAAVRSTSPAIVLLDVDLPGTSGLEVCRTLRTDPELNDTPVVFLTGRATSADRIAGLTVGGDDYVVKPAEPAELRLRIERVLQQRTRRPAPSDDVLAREVFLTTARTALQSSQAALALVRLPRERPEIAGELAREVRRRDLVARYDDRHAMVLMPGVSVADAAVRLSAWLTAIVERLGESDPHLHAGVAPVEQGSDLRAGIERADEALAEARYRRVLVAVYGQQKATPAAPVSTSIVVAEDDPDVMRLLDSRLQAAGYRTTLAFDGQAALDAIGTTSPDLVLLDLMMPRLTGFEVLTAMKRTTGRRPPVVVVSARGREADVTRAFQLGADDYLTKPFGPEELLARVSRLLR